jgi:hypothetical protein
MAGDNRGFMAYDKQNRFRVMSQVTIFRTGQPWVVKDTPGKSHGWMIQPGQERDVDRILITPTRVTYLGGEHYRIRVQGIPKFPFFSEKLRMFEFLLIPAAEYDLTIDVTPTSVTVNGEHDDYPAYEVWVYRDNCPPVLKYSYDNRWTGTDVTGVPGPSYIEVTNNKWTHIRRPQDPVSPMP